MQGVDGQLRAKPYTWRHKQCRRWEPAHPHCFDMLYRFAEWSRKTLAVLTRYCLSTEVLDRAADAMQEFFNYGRTT